MTISENLQYIHSQLPDGVQLIAVSKTKGVDVIREAYDSGQRHFGENKVQELLAKYQQLPDDVHWHFIGHLQTNKVSQIAPFISLIHGVDSLKLLRVINREAERCNRIIPVLLEFHIAKEESKFGLSWEAAEEMLKNPETFQMRNVLISGVMGMATFTEEQEIVRSEFEQLAIYFRTLKEQYFQGQQHFCEISMGMSDDFPIAVQSGSTMVRIGGKIFGSR